MATPIGYAEFARNVRSRLEEPEYDEEIERHKERLVEELERNLRLLRLGRSVELSSVEGVTPRGRWFQPETCPVWVHEVLKDVTPPGLTFVVTPSWNDEDSTSFSWRCRLGAFQGKWSREPQVLEFREASD